MALSDLDNVALYERETLWNWDYREDSYYRTKLQLIGGMIPSGVKTILDVGCGNGAIANELACRGWVVAGDRSGEALSYVRTPRVQLSVDSLPFKERSFDLVMSHQLLEHLPDHVFARAINEMTRVAAGYLLLSIPFRDAVKEARACCAECRFKYNVWGHLRSFNRVTDVRRLFPDFALRVHAFCGRENEYMTSVARWACQWIGGRWTLQGNALCPNCRSKLQYRATNFPQLAIAAIAHRLDHLVPKKKAFWWLVCLLERLAPASQPKKNLV